MAGCFSLRRVEMDLPESRLAGIETQALCIREALNSLHVQAQVHSCSKPPSLGTHELPSKQDASSRDRSKLQAWCLWGRTAE